MLNDLLAASLVLVIENLPECIDITKSAPDRDKVSREKNQYQEFI